MNIILIAITEEKMKREGTIWFWVYWAKCWFWNEENVIDVKWSDVQEEDEEDIAKTNFIDSSQKQTD